LLGTFTAQPEKHPPFRHPQHVKRLATPVAGVADCGVIKRDVGSTCGGCGCRRAAARPDHHTAIQWGGVLLDKIEEPDARHWYVRATADGGWSRNVLLNQIKARAHARAGAAPSNFELTLPGEDSELAGQIAKDPYVLDFLRFSGRVAERDRETALVGRMRDTLLEPGTGFAVRRAPGPPHISADQGTRGRRGPGGDHPAGLGRGRGRSRAVPRGVRPDAPRPGRADPQPRKHGSA